MRILGLDIGSRRIGVAVSDELGFTAQGVETLNRKDLAADLDRIATLAGECGATEIVVGVPYNMDGSEGPQARMVRTMIDQIQNRTGLPVREWDERLSTVAAERAHQLALFQVPDPDCFVSGSRDGHTTIRSHSYGVYCILVAQ